MSAAQGEQVGAIYNNKLMGQLINIPIVNISISLCNLLLRNIWVGCASSG